MTGMTTSGVTQTPVSSASASIDHRLADATRTGGELPAEEAFCVHGPGGLAPDRVLQVSPTKAVSVIEPLDPVDIDTLPDLTPGAALADIERFDAVLDPQAPLLLATWTTLTEARAETPTCPRVRIRHAQGGEREYSARRAGAREASIVDEAVY